MSKTRIISPSLLSADFSCVQRQISLLEKAGVTRLHLDVMDGHFVPNLTFGPFIVEAIRRATSCHLECHLMIEEPGRYIQQFADAGADTIIVHREVVPSPADIFSKIRSLHVKTGISLNPDTPVEDILSVLPETDYVLLMSVFPGFGGQKFIPESLNRLRRLADLKREHPFLLAIDGGINTKTIASVFQAGVDIAVVGSALFGAGDLLQRYGELTHD